MKRLQILAVLIVAPFLTFADSSDRQLQIFFDGSGHHSALPVVDLSAPEASLLVPLAVPAGGVLPVPAVAPQAVPPPPAGTPVADDDGIGGRVRRILKGLADGGGEAHSNPALVNPVNNLARQLQGRYWRQVTPTELRDGALQGMLQKLDPHSALFTPEQIRMFQEQMGSSFVGIGAVVEKRDNGVFIKVNRVILNSPAYKAGLKAGDLISEINGEDTRPINLDVAIGKMRGEIGSTIKLTILSSDGESSMPPREVVIKRDKVEIPDFYSSMIAPGVGYVVFTGFNQDASAKFKKALDALSRQGMKKLVVDLRDNPGGLVDEVVRVCEHLLPADQVVVSSKGEHEAQEQFRTHRDGAHRKLPVVVLTDEGSASASEIMAGALQDLKRAQIIGARTFGKGSVQVVFDLADLGIHDMPDYAAKITVAHYYLPSGRGVEGDGNGEGGIKPDIEVKTTYKQDIQIVETREARLNGLKVENPAEDPVLDAALKYLDSVK